MFAQLICACAIVLSICVDKVGHITVSLLLGICLLHMGLVASVSQVVLCFTYYIYTSKNGLVRSMSASGKHQCGSHLMKLKLVTAGRVNLWYFFVERNIWKDDDSNDDEEEEEEESSSDITDSEQEEKKVRSRRLPARR